MQGSQIQRNKTYAGVRCNNEGYSATQPFGFAQGREHVEGQMGLLRSRQKRIHRSAPSPFSKNGEEFVDLIGVNLHPVIIPLHLFAEDEVIEDMFTEGIPHQIALLSQLYGLDQATR